MNPICTALFVLLAAPAASMRTLAQDAMLRIDMSGNAVVQQSLTAAGNQLVFLHQPTHDISTTIDPGTAYSVWSASDGFRGDTALAIKIDRENRPEDVSQKSKFEINVVRHDDDALDEKYGHRYILRNRSGHYLGFAFKMDRDLYESPTRWVLHFQVWQCCSTRGQPPLALQVIPNRSPGPVDFVMMERDDDDRKNPPRSDNGERLRFAAGDDHLALERGRWYRIVIFLQPDPGAPAAAGGMPGALGKVDMWLDGKLVLSHVGPWGYTQDSDPDIRDAYDVKLGIYRAAQNTRQQVYFDRIRWGTTWQAVDPDRP